MVFQLSPEELPEKLMFFTQNLLDWFNVFMAKLYRREESPKYIIHTLNFKDTIELLPDFMEALKQKSNDFLGICNGAEFVGDKSKVLGMTEAGLLVIQTDGMIIGVRLNILVGADFMGLPAPYEGTNALDEVYQSFGLPQFIEKEIVEKKYLENLFSNEKLDEKTLNRLRALSDDKASDKS